MRVCFGRILRASLLRAPDSRLAALCGNTTAYTMRITTGIPVSRVITVMPVFAPALSPPRSMIMPASRNSIDATLPAWYELSNALFSRSAGCPALRPA